MKVDIDVIGPNQAKVKIDDKEIRGLTAVKFEASVDDFPSVTLSFYPTEINCTADTPLAWVKKEEK
ncbi:hypothetical protein [Bacillus sp. FJAT-29814]|uniref:hypothetical protein n=1 Tax=Bacillus sp. FJAT-29814 TaxID=1729688 RepID=UPI0008300EF9|nr:hypothetical protein [Bacillus sp. FJAT-29814]